MERPLAFVNFEKFGEKYSFSLIPENGWKIFGEYGVVWAKNFEWNTEILSEKGLEWGARESFEEAVRRGDGETMRLVCPNRTSKCLILEWKEKYKTFQKLLIGKGISSFKRLKFSKIWVTFKTERCAGLSIRPAAQTANGGDEKEVTRETS